MRRLSHRPHRPVAWLALAVVSGSLLVRLTAGVVQETQTFRSGVEIARIEVSVLDKQRRPVRGLKPEDFEIRVQGQAQPIVSLSEVSIPEPDQSRAKWTREVGSEVGTNDLADTRLFIIIMDDVNTPPEPWMIRNGKAAARRFIETLAPNDLASVIFTWNNNHAQELTRDHARLLQAVDAFSFGPPKPFLMAADYAHETLISAVRTLSEASQFRSAVLLVSVGGPWADDARRRLEPTFALARVPVYGISIQGLQSPIVMDRNNTARINPSGASRATDALKNLADRSGGFAVTDTNDPLPAVSGIVRENNTYYVIGYRALYPTADGRSRRLVVRVKKPRVEVLPAARTIESGARKASKPTVPAITRALQDIVPDADVPLRVSVAPFGSLRGTNGERDPPIVVVTLQVTEALPAGTRSEALDLETRAFDGEGRQELASTRQTARVTLRPDSDGTARYEVLSRLDLKPGRYNLRFATRSATSSSTASVYTDVVVPDFANDPLTISGVVVHQTPALTSGPEGLFDSLIPIVPTTEREFASGSRVSAFLRVYQGGRRAVGEVALSTRIVDERDAAVLEKSERLAIDRFDPIRRSADYLFEVPTARLAPGRYLLRFEATLGSVVGTRDVRFRVK